jgi:signal transduction histidine kinase
MNETFSIGIQAFLVVIGLITIVNLVRFRDLIRLDIALPFGTLALNIILSRLADTRPAELHWVEVVGRGLLLLQPYFILRMVRYFRPVARIMWWIALGGALISIGATIVFPTETPTVIRLILVSYFIIVEGYTAVCFVLGAFTTRGVTRWRLRLLAAGTGSLAGFFLLAGFAVAFPSLAESDLSVLVAEGLVLGLALFYYLGLTPPRWLRRIWQLAELEHFLKQSASLPAEASIDAVLHHLDRAAKESVGAPRATVARWDESKQKLLLPAEANAATDLLNRALRERRTVSYTRHGQVHLYRSSGSRMQAVPLATHEHTWGMLLVFRDHPALFPDDDLNLLTLLADQTAVILGYKQLLSEQQALTEQLQGANRELESFSYSVSHDLRAPLRAVDGFSKILVKDFTSELSPKAAHYLDLVRENTQQMSELVEDLLEFSRLSRQPPKKRRVDLTVLARAVVEDIRRTTTDRRVEVTVGELSFCEADPTLLKQVFINLVSNAFKFTGQKEMATIEIGVQQGAGEQVYFVRDNGVGFDMQYVDKLFGVFQRLHRAEDYEGTGVGLAIVQRIIQRHEGRIWVESAVDQGTTFYFTLGSEAGDESNEVETRLVAPIA